MVLAAMSPYMYNKNIEAVYYGQEEQDAVVKALVNVLTI